MKSQEQYEAAQENGLVNANEIYLTPDELDLSIYATKEELEEKINRNGDTIPGNLTIENNSPSIVLQDADTVEGNYLDININDNMVNIGGEWTRLSFGNTVGYDADLIFSNYTGEGWTNHTILHTGNINNYVNKQWKELARFESAGDYTYTLPNNITEVGIFALGGGGSGANSTGHIVNNGSIADGSITGGAASGGGSGALVQKIISVNNIPQHQLTIHVGAGGAGVSRTVPKPGGVDGNPGEDTVVNSIRAAGGLGGKAKTDYNNGKVMAHSSLGFGQPSDTIWPGTNTSAPYGNFIYEILITDTLNTSSCVDVINRNASRYAFNGINIFDPNDEHIYCGAGGGAYGGSSSGEQAGAIRQKGSSGSGMGMNVPTSSSSPYVAESATAPGDGGGGIACNYTKSSANSYKATLTSGAGADGLVIIYGR